MSQCPRRACLHAKQILVSSTIPRPEGAFWSVQFRLSTRYTKFSNEVLHAKFDLQIKEVFRRKEIWHRKSTVGIQYNVEEWRKSLVWLSRKSMFCHERFPRSLSEIQSHLNPSTFTGNKMYLH